MPRVVRGGKADMPEGSSEAQIADPMGLDSADAERFLRDQGLLGDGESLMGEGEGQAEATDGTGTTPVQAKPEDAADDGAEAAKPQDGEAVGAEDAEVVGKPRGKSGADLSHLPGNLREALEGQPESVVAAALAVYKSIQQDQSRKADELSSRRREMEELIGYGETLRALSGDDEAHAKLQEAVTIFRQRSRGEPEDADADLDGILDAPDDDTMKANLRKFIRREAAKIAQETLHQQLVAPNEKVHAIQNAGRAVMEEMGASGEVAEAAWAEMQEDLGDGVSDVTPENVARYFKPYLKLAMQRATTQGKTPAAKPPVPKGRQTAGMLSDPNVALPKPTASQREQRTLTLEQMAEEALREAGISMSDFNRGVLGGLEE